MAIEKHVVQLTAQDQLSPALKNVAKNATDAGTKAEQAAKRASTATADWGKAAQNMGRVLGAVGAAAILLGNQSQVSQSRLEQSIANTGDSYELLEDQINATTDAALKLGFDDEDAIDAITSLTDATGDAETAMSDLSIAQDIARGRGISLAAATNIVIAAEQGRYGALKRMGIAIDENATKEDALAALHAKYAGQAEAYAATNAAAWDRMGNAIENRLEVVGGALADIQGPLIALGGASQLIGPLGDTFQALGGKAGIASKATALLSSSLMGPIGLAVGVGLAGAAIYTLITTESQAEQQAKALTAATESYTASIVANTTALVNAGVYDQVKATQDLLDVWIDSGLLAQNRIDSVNASIVEMQGAVGSALPELYDTGQAWDVIAAKMTTLDGAQKEYIKTLLQTSGALDDGVVTADELSAILPQLSSGFELSAAQATALTTAMQGVEEAAANPQLFGAELAAEATKILADMHAGIIDVDEAIRQLNALPVAEKYNKALREANKTTTELNTQVQGLEFGVGDLNQMLVKASGGLGLFKGGADAAGDAISAVANDDIAALNASLQDIGASGLDRYMQMIVGFTDGIVGSISAAKDWADTVIEGTAEQISITEDYNRALAASQKIQAMQAPLIAAQSDAAADYVENLANMSAEEQLLALAWADQDMAGRANQLAEMASEYDSMSKSQKQAFEQMILSAAATDPALAAILESLNLIEKGTDGEYVLGLGVDGQSEVDRLIDSIDYLTEVLAEAFGIEIDHSQVDTSDEAVGRLIDSIFGIDDPYPYIGVNDSGVEAALTGVANLRQNIINLDGLTSNTYSYHHVITEETRRTDRFALGGTAKMDTAALGRAGRGLTLVGEHGPEMVTLPHGSMVTPNHATRYAGSDREPGIVINIDRVVAQDFNSFVRQMREYEKGMNRR